MTKITRRDFLKISAAYAAGAALASLQPALARPGRPEGKAPGIIVLVFDAMSARNLSVYGYARPTTPNLERFAARATVYHSHYSGGNFTSPGTASMLTGLYPWNHRALNNDSPIRRDLVPTNLFHQAGEDFLRVGYSQNLWADIFLRQFRNDIDMHLSPSAFLPEGSAKLPSEFFPNDPATAYFALDTFPFTTRQVQKNLPGSLLWGYLDLLRKASRYDPNSTYPHGQPNNGFFSYTHPSIFRGLENLLEGVQQEDKPHFGYFHFFSPHMPFAPRSEFIDKFEPLGIPNSKRHPLAVMNATKKEMAESRDLYDAFLADLDAEFGITLDLLEQSGILDTNYVVITSDHGELFERGEIGHGSSLLYDPVIHIPLLISAPGQTQRRDVHSLTSNIDLVPTLMSLAGKSANQVDGQVLPGFGGNEDDKRGIYSMVAKNTSAMAPFRVGTIALQRGEYKLIYYFGHAEQVDPFEMYSLADDPDEKRNIFAPDLPEARRMKEELLTAFNEANQPYKRK